MMNETDEPLSIILREENEREIFYLKGILNATGALELSRRVFELKTEAPFIELNLSELRLVTSAGLGAIVEIIQHLKDKNMKVKLTNPSTPVQRVLTLVHIDKMAEIVG